MVVKISATSGCTAYDLLVNLQRPPTSPEHVQISIDHSKITTFFNLNDLQFLQMLQKNKETWVKIFNTFNAEHFQETTCSLSYEMSPELIFLLKMMRLWK